MKHELTRMHAQDLMRVERKLTEMKNTPAVFWSSTCNSYVIIASWRGQWSHPYYGNVTLLCINGAGEIRWIVDRWEGQNEDGKQAVAYFDLTPAE